MQLVLDAIENPVTSFVFEKKNISSFYMCLILRTMSKRHPAADHNVVFYTKHGCESFFTALLSLCFNIHQL